MAAPVNATLTKVGGVFIEDTGSFLANSVRNKKMASGTVVAVEASVTLYAVNDVVYFDLENAFPFTQTETNYFWIHEDNIFFIQTALP